jgi:hypothetical protein
MKRRRRSRAGRGYRNAGGGEVEQFEGGGYPLVVIVCNAITLDVISFDQFWTNRRMNE